MKKMNRIITAVLLLITIICVLASCGSSGKPHGTYTYADSGSAQVTKLVFQGNRVTITDMSVSVRCSYTIKDGQFSASGTTTLLGTEVSVDYDYAFEMSGDSIYLDGKKYVKE